MRVGGSRLVFVLRNFWMVPKTKLLNVIHFLITLSVLTFTWKKKSRQISKVFANNLTYSQKHQKLHEMASFWHSVPKHVKEKRRNRLKSSVFRSFQLTFVRKKFQSDGKMFLGKFKWKGKILKLSRGPTVLTRPCRRRWSKRP